MAITYYYECRLCGHKDEIKQSMKDDALTTCTSCQEEGFYRVIQRTNFILKGGGKTKWYQEEHKKTGKNYLDFVSDKTRQKLKEAEEAKKEK